MRILTDQDVYKKTIDFLRAIGHDVWTASEVGLSTASDEEILLYAKKHGCILVTRDRDFGHLVFVRGMKVGVLYLRMTPTTVDEVHRELARVLAKYTFSELRSSFVVVEAGRHRFRRIIKCIDQG